MKKIYETIREYMLQFDFSKKVVFVLSCSIFAAIYLFVNVAITQHSLSSTIKNQLVGMDFHKKAMNIFQHIVVVEPIELEDPIKLKTKLKSTVPLLTAFFDELKLSLKKFETDKYNFYNDTVANLRENIFLTLKSIDDLETKSVNTATYELLINKLKKQLLNLMEVIKYAYELDKSLDVDNRSLLDLVLNKFPVVQNNLSILNFFKEEKDFSLFLAEVKKNVLILDQSLDILNLLQQNNFHILNNSLIDLKSFTDNIEELINLLSKSYESNSIPPSNTKLLNKTIISEVPLIYNNLSRIIISNLSQEDEFYHLKQLISGILLLCGISVVLTPYLTRAFHNPLSELKVAAEKLAAGDLSTRVPIIRSDEVGEVSSSFNQVARVLEQIMIETDKFASLLSKSTSEVFKTAKNLEDTLHLQEHNIHSINSHSKAISKNTIDFSSGLSIVDHAVRLTAENISQSKDSLDIMESIMQQMVSSADNTIVELSSIKTEIDKIFQVIDTLVIIADQINLLSLNTAVRANKAGVKKFGFSVIAEKISELSDQTAFATLDIEQIVEKILSYVPKIIQDVDLFSREIQEALSDSLDVKSHFQKLLKLTQKQITTFRDIQYEMIEQTHKACEIDRSFESLIQSTQKTTRSVRSLYVEIEYLYHSTLNLQKMVKRFVENKIEKE